MEIIILIMIYNYMTYRYILRTLQHSFNPAEKSPLKIVLRNGYFYERLRRPDSLNMMVLIYACQVSSLKVYGVKCTNLDCLVSRISRNALL